MTSAHSFTRSTFIAGAAALAAAPLAGRAADLAVIRAGTIPADVSAVITYANDLGYFKDAGLDVEISLMQSGPVIAPAVIGGTLDVGAANIASIAAARERGLPLKFFAPASIATPTTLTDPVMVKKDSPIKSAADLNGKTVAIVAMKTMQDAAFRLWVDKHGGDAKQVKLIARFGSRRCRDSVGAVHLARSGSKPAARQRLRLDALDDSRVRLLRDRHVAQHARR